MTVEQALAAGYRVPPRPTRPCKRGHDPSSWVLKTRSRNGSREVSWTCVICRRAHAIKANQKYWASERGKLARRRYSETIHQICSVACYGAKARDARDGLTGNDLTVKYIEERYPKDGRCPKCSREMRVRTKYAPTLDKYVPTLSHHRGNVSFLCKECNRLKNNLTLRNVEEDLMWRRVRRVQLNEERRWLGIPLINAAGDGLVGETVSNGNQPSAP